MSKSPKNTRKHTPGPWRTTEILQDNGPDIIGVFGPRSASSGFNGFCVAHVAKESDACLIAAAPELLRELKSALFFIKSFKDHEETLKAHEVYSNFAAGGNWEAVASIIAKAEGSDNV